MAMRAGVGDDNSYEPGPRGESDWLCADIAVDGADRFFNNGTKTVQGKREHCWLGEVPPRSQLPTPARGNATVWLLSGQRTPNAQREMRTQHKSGSDTPRYRDRQKPARSPRRRAERVFRRDVLRCRQRVHRPRISSESPF